jgi:L-threonylcarbamoyladenylate synthase
MTTILTVDTEHPDLRVISAAAEAIRDGCLVAFPTETVYGLGAHALDVAAIGRLFQAKGRPATDPMIVHIARQAQLADIVQEIPRVAHELIATFWPGPLTLILPKREHVPDAVTAGRPTVGVRVPAHPVARALLDAAGVPIAAPSANRFSRPSPTTAQHVMSDLPGVVDLILDAGPTPVGVESTVLDLTVSPPVVRRPGGVTVEQLQLILPTVIMNTAALTASASQPSPGQLLRHYAPAHALTLYLGPTDRVVGRLAEDVRAAVARGLKVGVLAPAEDLVALAPRLAAVAAAGRVLTRPYGSRLNVAAAARDLYHALRELDAEEIDVILATAPEPRGLGAAIVDRLTRAAEGRIVSDQ